MAEEQAEKAGVGGVGGGPVSLLVLGQELYDFYQGWLLSLPLKVKGILIFESKRTNKQTSLEVALKPKLGLALNLMPPASCSHVLRLYTWVRHCLLPKGAALCCFPGHL